MDMLFGKRGNARKWIQLLTDPAQRGRAAQELLRLGPQAVDDLVLALASPQPEQAKAAEQILVRMGETAVPRLKEHLRSAPSPIRHRLPDLLGHIRHPSAIAALLEGARLPDPQMRAQVALALAKTGERQVVPALLTLVNDPEPQVRRAAAQALSTFPDAEVLRALQYRLLEDPEIEVRQAAAYSLGILQSPEALSWLIEALTDPFWWYERPEEVIRPLQQAILAYGAEAIEPLCELVRHPESTVRRLAVRWLGLLRKDQAMETLHLALYDIHFDVAEEAARSLANYGAAALNILQEAAQAMEMPVRLHALHGLTYLNDERALPLIAALLADPERQVRLRAIHALGERGDRRALAWLTPLAEQRADREMMIAARQAIQSLQNKTGKPG